LWVQLSAPVRCDFASGCRLGSHPPLDIRAPPARQTTSYTTKRSRHTRLMCRTALETTGKFKRPAVSRASHEQAFSQDRCTIDPGTLFAIVLLHTPAFAAQIKRVFPDSSAPEIAWPLATARLSSSRSPLAAARAVLVEGSGLCERRTIKEGSDWSRDR
jgi:hypothetical protein